MKPRQPSSHWCLWVIGWKINQSQTTQAALKKLAVTQKTKANKIVYDEKQAEHIIQRLKVLQLESR